MLLLDAGDTIQGSALAYYHHRRNPVPPEPTIKVMSHMGFDAMTVGNHEFNFGLEAIDKSSREAGFPWLSANIINDDDGSPYFSPYIVKELEGIRVGILGLTTPNIPNSGDARTLRRSRFSRHRGDGPSILPICGRKKRWTWSSFSPTRGSNGI